MKEFGGGGQDFIGSERAVEWCWQLDCAQCTIWECGTLLLHCFVGLCGVVLYSAPRHSTLRHNARIVESASLQESTAHSPAPICTRHCCASGLWWSGPICSFETAQHAGSYNALQLWRNSAPVFRMTGQFSAKRNSQVAASGPSINIAQLKTPRTTRPTWLHFHRSGVSIASLTRLCVWMYLSQEFWTTHTREF
jgi:hypothetical protein